MVRLLGVLIVGLSVAFAGCNKQQEPAKVTASDVRDKASQTATAAGDYAKQEKDLYVSKMNKEMDEMKVEIDKLKAKARTANAKTKAKLESGVQAVEAKYEVAKQKLRELGDATGDTWAKLKAGVDNAMEDLKQVFTRTKKESA